RRIAGAGGAGTARVLPGGGPDGARANRAGARFDLDPPRGRGGRRGGGERSKAGAGRRVRGGGVAGAWAGLRLFARVNSITSSLHADARGFDVRPIKLQRGGVAGADAEAPAQAEPRSGGAPQKTRLLSAETLRRRRGSQGGRCPPFHLDWADIRLPSFVP